MKPLHMHSRQGPFGWAFVLKCAPDRWPQMHTKLCGRVGDLPGTLLPPLELRIALVDGERREMHLTAVAAGIGGELKSGSGHGLFNLPDAVSAKTLDRRKIVAAVLQETT